VALADSGRAIGPVTRLLRDHLIRRGFDVSVGCPQDAARADTNDKLNLSLYEMCFDASMRNLAPDPPPLWLTLKYLLTAFDAGKLSASATAHELLGCGLSELQELSFLRLDPLIDLRVRLALETVQSPSNSRSTRPEWTCCRGSCKAVRNIIACRPLSRFAR
jgi:hypothetical protein